MAARPQEVPRVDVGEDIGRALARAQKPLEDLGQAAVRLVAYRLQQVVPQKISTCQIKPRGRILCAYIAEHYTWYMTIVVSDSAFAYRATQGFIAWLFFCTRYVDGEKYSKPPVLVGIKAFLYLNAKFYPTSMLIR